MKTRLALLLHVPALAATLAAAGCGDRARDDDTLRIGAIVEMTGEMPAVGASSRNAAATSAITPGRSTTINRT